MRGYALTAAAIAGLAGLGGSEAPTEPTIPDRLSVDPNSPAYDPIYKELGLRFDGVERDADVQEFCVSEGWIEVRLRNAKGQFIREPNGEFKVERLVGRPEPYFKKAQVARTPIIVDPAGDKLRIEAAQAKRDRKAEKLKGKA
jgi:hypothetical protein